MTCHSSPASITIGALAMPLDTVMRNAFRPMGWTPEVEAIIGREMLRREAASGHTGRVPASASPPGTQTEVSRRKIARAIAMSDAGKSPNAIAAVLGIKPNTVSGYLRVAALPETRATLERDPASLAAGKTPRAIIQQALEAACEAEGITLHLARSRDCHRIVSRRRQRVMARLHAAGWSYSDIALELRRDHTTVMHGVRVAAEREAQA